MTRTITTAENGFNLDGYFPNLSQIGLTCGATEEEVSAAAERELTMLDANEPDHGVELWELEQFFYQWCRLPQN